MHALLAAVPHHPFDEPADLDDTDGTYLRKAIVSALARAPVSGRFRIDDPDAALEQLRLTMSLDLRRFPGGIAVLG